MLYKGLKEIYNDESPLKSLSEIVDDLHRNGPDASEKLEKISLYKNFKPDDFASVEENLIASMGLFHKIKSPESFYAYLMRLIAEKNKTNGGETLTPVQTSLRIAIEEMQYVSIAAPTSAGKSYSVRDFISSVTGDAVIIVPSRALIAEYIKALRAHFSEDKDVMVMPFVDVVFKSRVRRRIFVLTPERAREIFEKPSAADIAVFFFDEAQVSEEDGRGIVFDTLIRRAKRTFPTAKMIFAHPFVENPEAQLIKHGILNGNSFHKNYKQGAVGKVFIQKHGNGSDYYFSPYEDGGVKLRNCIEFSGNFQEFAFSKARTVLAYVSKNSIYNGSFLKEFSKHIDGFPQINEPEANRIILEVEHLVGADAPGHKSRMVSLLKKGVVIHHGSVPLEVRFLVEEFIRLGYARICFATSTLAQGVNMPFDVVWLGTMHLPAGNDARKSLALKNLIGRAGRLSSEKKFDYGYVYTKSARLLSARLSDKFTLSEKSVLDADDEDVAEDDREVIDAIRNDTFDDELHMPNSRAERLAGDHVQKALAEVLALIYSSGQDFAASLLRGPENKHNRILVATNLGLIYESYIGRSLLDGERSIFKEAIFILIQIICGRTFREIVGLRFSRVSNRDDHSKLNPEFSQPAAPIPDKKLHSAYPLYSQASPKSGVSYDVLVFDTYDYIDQVISFCLSDTFSAAAKIYYRNTKDQVALKFVELLRFGTNDPTEVMLLRYGFAPEIIDKLAPHVQSVDEQQIIFRPSVSGAGDVIQKAVSWYV